MNRKLVKRKQKAKQQILQENQKQKFESLRDVFCDRKLDRNQKAQKRLKLWQSFSKTLGGKKENGAQIPQTNPSFRIK